MARLAVRTNPRGCPPQLAAAVFTDSYCRHRPVIAVLLWLGRDRYFEVIADLVRRTA
jgi:hypothetical protein